MHVQVMHVSLRKGTKTVKQEKGNMHGRMQVGLAQLATQTLHGIFLFKSRINPTL